MKEKPGINFYLSRSLKWPKYLFFAFFIFILFQIFPFPKFLIKLISPGTYSYKELLFIDFNSVKTPSVSMIPAHTFREALELISYFMLGFLVVKTITRKKQIKRIFYVLIFMGTFEALYGLYELTNQNPRILFYKKIYGLDVATGTFFNRNHFSGYLEMILPLALGLIISRIVFVSERGWRLKEALLRLTEKGLGSLAFFSLGVLSMFFAIVYSQSRTGIFILGFTIVCFFVFASLYFKKSFGRRKKIFSFIKIGFLLIALISLYFGIVNSVERFDPDNLARESRPTIWANSIRIFLKFPVFGSGLGTFSSIYRDIEEETGKPQQVTFAHNDYLEYLTELGLVGAGMLVGGVFLIIVISLNTWKKRRRADVKGMGFGGLVAAFCILIHSFTDFNLHIPANMLLFSVLLSLTLVVVFYKKHSDGEPQVQKKSGGLY
jgi:O-antigen ligase